MSPLCFRLLSRLLWIVLGLAVCASPAQSQHRHYLILVTDAATHEPVPCVELTTTHGLTHTSDRNGRIAFYEPGLMDRYVHFRVEREGYLHRADGLGVRGRILTPSEGGVGRIELNRVGIPGPCDASNVDTRLAFGLVPGPEDRFEIEVTDAETGIGIPLVELRWAGGRHYTDSGGRVAFHALHHMSADIAFEVSSHGYRSPAEPIVLTTTPGDRVRIELERINIAERLYRITGAGIYRDSLLLGYEPPIRAPLIDTGVMGQDTVVTTLHRGRIFWAWGDTRQPAHPLSNFRVTAATSEVQRDGGLDPELGIDLDYFARPSGDFVRVMAPEETVPNPTSAMGYAVWFNSLISVPDAAGTEHLHASYSIVKGFDASERGLAHFDEDREVFATALVFEPDDLVIPRGPNFRWWHGEEEYVYFRDGIRVRAREEALLDPARYESFTPLEPGSASRIERDAQGMAVYDWKTRTPPITRRTLNDGTVAAAPEDLLIGHVHDPDSGVRMIDHKNGSIAWNPYRSRFLRFILESDGASSDLGEVWVAEGDTPMGPWVYARKVVSHDRMSFYNPLHHPYFDRQGGRIVYFEGTYTRWLSGLRPTPRYDYNQIMYRLDLDDERIALPVPVYDMAAGGTPGDFVTKRGLRAHTAAPVASFFALDRPVVGSVPVHWTGAACGERRLETGTPSASRPIFYAIAPGTPELPPDAVALYEYRDVARRRWAYAIDDERVPRGFERQPKPLAWVWRNPIPHALPASDYLPDLVADAGPDQCTRERKRGRGRRIRLDATRSLASAATILSHRWSWQRGARTAEGPTPTIRLAAGIHEIELRVTGEDGSQSLDYVVVEVAQPSRHGLFGRRLWSSRGKRHVRAGFDSKRQKRSKSARRFFPMHR